MNYALGGALAVAAWAEARPTQAVHLIIDPPQEQQLRFADELAGRDVLIPPDAGGDTALAAYHRRWGYRAEFLLVRPGDELRRSALARRRPVDLGAPLGTVAVLAPEDLILDKLVDFSRAYESEPARDIITLVLAQEASLDDAYLGQWTDRLGLDAIWRYMSSLARPIE